MLFHDPACGGIRGGQVIGESDFGDHDMRMKDVWFDGRTRQSDIAHASISRRTAIQAGSISLLGLGMNHVAALRAADGKLVNLGNNETWDTHDNFPLLRDCLLPPTDRGLAALLDDLQTLGLLDETLIVMCGEMGRTPKVNALNRSPGAKAGRDHWGAVQTVFVAGGGVKGGLVVGSSDKAGAYPATDPQRPENLAATIYHALGIPATAAWKDEVDRPNHVYHSEPIRFA